jgi:purine-binding chemotaxis protein CheW
LASHSAGHWDEPGRPEEEQLKLAGFRVGGGLYGIDIMRIKEVIQARPYPIRNVPHAPGIVEGVIQLRGVVIPVVDLRKRFGTPIPEEDSRLNKLIIVSVRGRIIGLKIDRILGELRVPAGALRPAPSILRPQGGMPGEFFDGVCHSGDEMVFVVNLETIIDPRLHGKPSPPPSTSDAPAPAGHPREDT